MGKLGIVHKEGPPDRQRPQVREETPKELGEQKFALRLRRNWGNLERSKEEQAGVTPEQRFLRVLGMEKLFTHLSGYSLVAWVLFLGVTCGGYRSVRISCKQPLPFMG
jgi:hypothetical protein